MPNNKLSNLEKIFSFLHKIENLKSTLRYSDTTSGRRESTAEHTWRLALLTFLIADELKLDLDVLRSVKIALVHDLAEALTGDIDAILIVNWTVSKEEKEKQEIEATKVLSDILPDSIGKEISGLWHEYNDNKTKEAKFVKALDKIETLTQLAETGYKIFDEHEFIAIYADKHVKAFPELMGMLKILKRKLKEEFTKWNFEWKDEYDLID